jgi:cytochrome c-type biogenesis protein
MDALFELLGKITNVLQPLLQQGELSLAMLSMVLVAGVVAGVTPFGLSMAVLVAGRAGAAAGDYSRSVPNPALRQALWFSLGSATSLFAAGVVAAAAGSVLADYRLAPYIPLLTLLMGAQLLVGWRWQRLSRLRPGRVERAARQRADNGDAFLLGLPFGVITAPCTAPIIVAVLSLIAANGGIVFGVLVLLAFTIGRSAPLVLGVTYGHRALARLGGDQRSLWLRRALGAVLVVASLYFLTDGAKYLGA